MTESKGCRQREEGRPGQWVHTCQTPGKGNGGISSRPGPTSTLSGATAGEVRSAVRLPRRPDFQWDGDAPGSEMGCARRHGLTKAAHTALGGVRGAGPGNARGLGQEGQARSSGSSSVKNARVHGQMCTHHLGKITDSSVRLTQQRGGSMAYPIQSSISR